MSPRNGPAGSARRGLRVAQVCGAVDGGAWLVPICAGLTERGYDVVAVVGKPEGTLAAALRGQGVACVATDQPFPGHSRVFSGLARRVPGLGFLRYVSYTIGYLRTVGRLTRLFRRLDVDAVQTHLITTTLPGRVAAWLARVPIRVTMIASPYHLESELFRRPDLATYWMDHRLLSGSKRIDDLYASFGVAERLRAYTYYGADPVRFDPAKADGQRLRDELGIPDGAPLIGQVAHFYAVVDGPIAPDAVRGRGLKGHEDFVDAAALVLERRPDAHFVLAGGGWGPDGDAHRADIVARVAGRGLAERVHFVGRREDVPDVLAALDVSVQCSLAENLGGTIESLLMARPTICTNVGGMPEAVRHQETGLVVPPGSPADLAAAMLQLVEDKSLAARLGSDGRALMLREFTADRMVDDVDRVLSDVARERGLTGVT